MVRPKPRQSGQAPNGLLKLKSPGVGGRISRSQCAQCQPVEKGCSFFALEIDEVDLVLPETERGLDRLDQARARFIRNRQAILDDLHARAEPDILDLRCRP